MTSVAVDRRVISQKHAIVRRTAAAAANGAPAVYTIPEAVGRSNRPETWKDVMNDRYASFTARKLNRTELMSTTSATRRMTETRTHSHTRARV